MEPQPSPRSLRRVSAVVLLPLAAIVATVVYLLTVQDRLPAEVAIHWDAGGRPDGFTSNVWLPWLTGGLALVITLPMMVFGLAGQASPFMGRTITAMAMGTTTFLVSLMLQSTTAQLDGGNASLLILRTIPISIAVALVAGSVAALIAGDPPAPPTTQEPAPPGAERISLASSETAVWAGRTPTGRSLLFVLAGAALINVVAAVSIGAWWLILFLAVVSVIVIAASNFSVTAGPSGVRAVGLFGFPRVHVPLGQITEASAGTVRAVNYGGWGLRLRPGGDSAILTRSGPALIVGRTDGSRLNITLDNPDRPAAVISTLLDRRATHNTGNHSTGNHSTGSHSTGSQRTP